MAFFLGGGKLGWIDIPSSVFLFFFLSFFSSFSFDWVNLDFAYGIGFFRNSNGVFGFWRTPAGYEIRHPVSRFKRRVMSVSPQWQREFHYPIRTELPPVLDHWTLLRRVLPTVIGIQG